MTIGVAGPRKGASSTGRQVMFMDLDDTLYRHHQVAGIVRSRIQAYMTQKLGVPQEKVAELTMSLYLAHGTTLAGLVASGYKIDYDDWHEFVHHGALDYDTLLHPDPSLRDILCSIDMPKYVLTNANKVHMERCLERLGISDCFQGTFYVENVMELAAAHGWDTQHAVLCKPTPRIYTLVAETLGVSMRDVIFFDDSTRNLASAHALGAFTVLVGADHVPEGVQGVDLAIPDMHALPRAMPQLLDQPGLVHDDHGHAHGQVAHGSAVPVGAAPSAITVPS